MKIHVECFGGVFFETEKNTKMPSPTFEMKQLTISVFPKIGVGPQNGWLIMENPIKMDELGVPLFSESSICYLWIKYTFHIFGNLPPSVLLWPVKNPDELGSTCSTCSEFLHCLTANVSLAAALSRDAGTVPPVHGLTRGGFVQFHFGICFCFITGSYWAGSFAKGCWKTEVQRKGATKRYESWMSQVKIGFLWKDIQVQEYLAT